MVRFKTTVSLATLAGLVIPTVPRAARAQQPAVVSQPVGVGTVGQPTVIPTVTLGDAIKLALRAHPSVVSAEAALDKAHASQRVALASWLPTASVNSSVQKGPSTRFNSATGQIVQVPTPYSGSVGFGANVTLFDGLNRVFQGKAANASAASAEASLVSQKFNVTLLTKQAFYGALAAVELERVQQTAVQRSQEQLKITREKLAAGSAVRSDTLSATVILGQARLALLNAQTQRATQEATLARLIGYDKPVRALGDSAAIVVADIDTMSIRADAMGGSPTIDAADAALRSATANANISRNSYLPTLRASYNKSRSGAAGTFGSALDFSALNPTYGLSFTLSWSIFDGLRREQSLWNAGADHDAAEASAADARRNVNAQVTQYLASLEAARSQMTIAAASREAADEGLRVQRERYRLGAATIVEVLQAQQQLDQAEVDGVNARVAYQIAKANLSALVGREL